MVFKTVLKVPRSALKVKEGSHYVEREDIPNLQQHSLLYFLRTSSYHTLHDYPCMGAFERRLDSSDIIGPYEHIPEFDKPEPYSNIEKEVIEALVPLERGSPLQLEPLSLVEYGTMMDSDSRHHLMFVARSELLPYVDNMAGIASNALLKLPELKKISETEYQGIRNGCFVEFRLRITGFYPDVCIKVLGKDKEPQSLVYDLGLYGLDEYFKFRREIGIHSVQRKGFAYDLSLEGQNISDILKSENIIL